MGLVILFLVVMTGWAAWHIWHGRATHSWTRTEGRVTRAEITRGDRGRSGLYRLVIQYEYEALGMRHRGSRLQYGYVGHLNRATSDLIRETYPVGASVTVLHDPADPIHSTLLPGFDRTSLYITIGAAACALVYFVVLN